jgi:hypothetical protein
MPHCRATFGKEAAFARREVFWTIPLAAAERRKKRRRRRLAGGARFEVRIPGADGHASPF